MKAQIPPENVLFKILQAIFETVEQLNDNFDVEKIVDFFGRTAYLKKALDESDIRAKEILDGLDNYTLEDFYKMEPIDGFTLMSVICLMTDDQKAATEKLVTQIESVRKEVEDAEAKKRKASSEKAIKARQPHPHKAAAKEFWDAWQADSNRFASDADFARKMVTHFGIDEKGKNRVSKSTIQKKWCPEWASQKIHLTA